MSFVIYLFSIEHGSLCQSEHMPTYSSRRTTPIGFAHRGARAYETENTLAAFALAIKLGATGLETDAWLTADGVAVLDHDGVVTRGLRKKSISQIDFASLPDHIPTFAALCEMATGLHLSVDVKDSSVAAVLIADGANAGVLDHLWLCHPDWSLVASWRVLDDDVRLVDSTRLRRVPEGIERRCAELRNVGVDAINMHHSDWSAGLVATAHRFEREAFAWDTQFERTIAETLAYGVDAVYCDYPDRMMDAIGGR